MDLRRGWRCLFGFTVVVCFMFFCLLVWTETALHSVGLCVISIIKDLLRGKQGEALLGCDMILLDDAPLQKCPNEVESSLNKIFEMPLNI